MTETKRPTVKEAEEILNLYFPVLDHGFISLKDYMGGDDGIEEAARTSYVYGNRMKSEQRNLIRYLYRHRHTSPFEQVEIKLHCAMPIFVARQWIRTRTASLNEMSGRYSLMPMLFYTPEAEHIQAQSTTNKQGRAGKLSDNTVNRFITQLHDEREQIASEYHWATENDIARELARIDLPQSTYTQWVWKIDGGNLLKTLGLRCDEHAQWETRQYFNVIAGMAKRLMPIAFEAWEDYEFYGCKMSRMEMEFIRRTLTEGPSTIPNPGMSKSEIAEYFAKLQEPTKLNFDLDLSTAKSHEYFENMYRQSAEQSNKPGIE
jgi:thymidylate synthase (FAD)